MRTLQALFIPALLAALIYGWSRNDYTPTEPPPIPPDSPYERQRLHELKRLPTGVDYLPPDPYRAAREHSAQMALFSTADSRFIDPLEKSAAGTWEALGPDNVGGRTRVIHPLSDGKLLAAGVSGGLWKRGTCAHYSECWTPLGDEFANLNVGAIAVDPLDEDVIYVGTGEVYRHTNRPYSSMTGGGLFKSIDGGETWVQVADTVGPDFMYISDVVISPNDSQRVYLASNTGVWASSDGGGSFANVMEPVNGDGQIMFEGCTDLEIHPGKARDWLLASCASRSTDDRYFLPGLLPDACNGPCDARIYLNKDAAGDGEWNVALTESGMGRTSMAAHHDNPDILYAVSSSIAPGPDFNNDGRGDYENGLHAVFRSDNGGQTWYATARNSDANKLNTFLLAYADMAFCDGIGPYSAGWYNQAIAVDPHDPDKVWVGGMQLYRSDDGGETFGLASYWYTANDVVFEYMHPDIHALYIPPDDDGVADRLWVGNDGGVWRSDDIERPVSYDPQDTCEPKAGGPNYRSLNRGYTTTQFYHGMPYADGQAYVGGLQDNGTVWTVHGDRHWMHILGGDGAISAVSPDGNDLYVAYQNAGFARYDQFWNFKWIFPGLRGNDNFLFITPIVLDPVDPTKVYVVGTRLWRSNTRGDFWEPASASPDPVGDFYSKMTAVALAPTWTSRVLMANGHGIYRHNQATFSNPNYVMQEAEKPRNGWVSSLIFDPNDEDIAYATYSTFGGQHVFKSTDGGLTWTSIDGSGKTGLPDVPVHTLAVHPNDPDRLYVGTDLGIYVTFDGGQNWAWEYSGFGNSIVESLQINRPTNPSDPLYLFAFTYGRGAWRAELDAVDAAPKYEIGPEVNGAWWQQEGQAMQLHYVDSNGTKMVQMGWYAHVNGQQVWIIGVGEVRGNQVVMDAFTASGSDFPPALNPDDVVVEPWGTITLTFSEPGKVLVGWASGKAGFSAGTMWMEQHVTVDDFTIDGTDINICKSGVWGNKDYDVGDGFIVQTVLIGGQPGAILAWYALKDGLGYWMAGGGLFDGNVLTVSPGVVTGGQFPPAYNVDTTDFVTWGELKLKFLENGRIHVTATPELDGFDPSSFILKQLDPPAGYGC